MYSTGKVLFGFVLLLTLNEGEAIWRGTAASVALRAVDSISSSQIVGLRGGALADGNNHHNSALSSRGGSTTARSKSKDSKKRFAFSNASVASPKKAMNANPTNAPKLSPWPGIGAGLAFAGSVTAAIWLTGRHLDERFHIHGRSGIAFDYPWRLEYPSAEVSAWIGYSLHNLSAWFVIWAAKQFHTKKYVGWSWPNYAMLGVHLVFALLHIVQTNVWYDGLARDVPEITSLGSVALMLMVIIALENPRRGFVLGKTVSFPKLMVETIKKFHGYFFTWALVYTFWYHPTEPTSGHLWGFFYLYLLLWQSVLVFAPLHFNRKWTTALELLVLPHSVMVAIEQKKGYTPMFVFGFLAVFVLTQMYGLEISSGGRRSIWLGYITSIVATYTAMGRWNIWHEITRIPSATYMVPYLMAAMFWPIERSLDMIQNKKKGA